MGKVPRVPLVVNTVCCLLPRKELCNLVGNSPFYLSAKGPDRKVINLTCWLTLGSNFPAAVVKDSN